MTIANIRRIKKSPPLSLTVQTAIKAYILENNLREGDALPSEGRLAAQLGVSRTSVREAVKVLSSFGLIEARTGSGLYVGRLSLAPILDNLTFGLSRERDEFAEAVETRRWIELGFADRLVADISEEQLAEIETHLDLWRVETAAGRYDFDQDQGFHRLLVAAMKNGLALRLLDLLYNVRQRALAVGAIDAPRDLDANFALHVEMYEALRARDAEWLRRAIDRHYDFVREEVQSGGNASARASAP